LESLLEARPSMAAIGNRLHRVMHDSLVARSCEGVEQESETAISRAIEADEECSRRASTLVAGKRILTLSRSGSVEAALLSAQPRPFVVVAESRPGNEGVGVAESLSKAGLAVALVTDAGMADAIEGYELGLVLLGADRVLPSGAIVNKIGSRLAALAAREKRLPTYVVSASDKVSVTESVEMESGDSTDMYRGAASIEVRNRRFELVPADLIDGIVTERGILRASDLVAIVSELLGYRRWRA
jgi:ribose 1,5-bisphosphate isomerase